MRPQYRRHLLAGRRRRARRPKGAAADASGKPLQRDVELAGRPYKLIVHPISPIYGRGFAVAAAVPIAELTVTSSALIERAAWVGGTAVGLAILAVLLVSFVLSRSMARLAAKTQRIRDLDFSDQVPVTSRITEVLRLSEAVERMREGLEVFGHYVSKNLVRQIMRSPASAGVGGERRDVTVMFTDIEGFSRAQRGHRAGAADQPAVALLRGAGLGDHRQSRHDRQVHR